MDPNDDAPLQARINDLSHEQEQMYADVSTGGGLSDADRARLEEIRVELEQAYDLLHQREAKRAAGQDPDDAQVRPPRVVEDYQQ